MIYHTTRRGELSLTEGTGFQLFSFFYGQGEGSHRGEIVV